ncbi:MAG TPA: ABC transporter substrate-binding protein, partial [Halomonas sp.]|nr:ABC transporter substrate-binding protein [Halomonas sp.]
MPSSPFGRFHAALQLSLQSLLLLFLTALPALAQNISPEQMIRDSVDELMGRIEGREDYFAENIDELKAVVDDSLADVADFRYIGASVMGRYFSNATPQQRSRFVNTFR